MSGLIGRTGIVGGAALGPADIAGCALWLRSDLGAYEDAAKTDPCENNDLIWVGEDQSGNGNDASQATASKRFIYLTGQLDGYPAWRSDGGDDLMFANGIQDLITGVDLPFSAFYVHKSVTIGPAWNPDVKFGWAGTVGSDMVGVGTMLGSPTEYWYAIKDGTGYVNLTYVESSAPYYAHIVVCAGTTLSVWQNGTLTLDAGGFAGGTFSGGEAFSIGAVWGTISPIFYSNTDFFEIAIYDNAISADSRALLDTYVAARYPSL